MMTKASEKVFTGIWRVAIAIILLAVLLSGQWAGVAGYVHVGADVGQCRDESDNRAGGVGGYHDVCVERLAWVAGR